MFFERNLKQTATLWTKGALDAYGNPTWSTPVAIKVRWEETRQKTMDAKGNTIISNAVVYAMNDIVPGSYLYLGSSSASSPPSTAWEVKAFNKIPSLKADKFERIAFL
jgi:hypothetical protein